MADETPPGEASPDSSPHGESLSAAKAAVDVEREAAKLSSAELGKLLSEATRLYAAASDARPLDFTDIDVNTTEAVVVAAALLRSQQITPFEFMIWFDRSS